MAQSHEIENGVGSDKKESSPEHPPGRKKVRYPVPKIDRHLELKWGLALLGEEKARQYLDWLCTRLELHSR